MPGVSLTQINFSEMLEPRFITHLELRDIAIAAADVDLDHLVAALKSLPMLTALGLCRVSVYCWISINYNQGTEPKIDSWS